MKNINEASTQNLDSFYLELVAEAHTMNFKKKEKVVEVEEIIELEDSEIDEDKIEIEDKN